MWKKSRHTHSALRTIRNRLITLQHTATTHSNNTLQHTATHCNTLQHTATYCNTLQHTATHSALALHAIGCTHCNTLQQHAAAHCNNTLQHAATDCNTLQHTATHSALALYALGCLMIPVLPGGILSAALTHVGGGSVTFLHGLALSLQTPLAKFVRQPPL